MAVSLHDGPQWCLLSVLTLFCNPLPHCTRVGLHDQWDAAEVMGYHFWDQVTKDCGFHLVPFPSLSFGSLALWEHNHHFLKTLGQPMERPCWEEKGSNQSQQETKTCQQPYDCLGETPLTTLDSLTWTSWEILSSHVAKLLHNFWSLETVWDNQCSLF